MSQTGLNLFQRQRARKRIVAAAYVMLNHSGACNYTQGSRRWEGIALHKRAYKGEFPAYSDCSSSSTWQVWDATRRYDLPDIVNGTNWTAGYTGTMQNHGARVTGAKLPGDMVFYGDQGGGIAQHVATYVGNGKVISHGGPGSHLLPWNYRPVNEVRRYIR